MGPYAAVCLCHVTVGEEGCVTTQKTRHSTEGAMNGPLKFLTARKILPLLDLLTKFKRVLACSCSPNFCSCSQARFLRFVVNIARNFVNPSFNLWV